MSDYPANQNEELDFPDLTYYFISGSIPDDYGGLTKSLLLRSKLFGECGIPTAFLTFRFDIAFRVKKKKLYDQQKVDPALTRILNMYEDFLGKKTSGRLYAERMSLAKMKKKAGRSQLVKKFGEFFGPKIDLDITFYDDGYSIRFADYFNHERKRYKREEYTTCGTLMLVTYFDVQTNQKDREEFINEENRVYLEKHYKMNSENDTVELAQINWYSEEKTLQFSNESDLRRHWIEVLQFGSDQPKLFLVDSRPQDKHVFKVKKAPTSYYAAIIHSKHYGDNKYQIKARYKELFSELPNVDALFFITEKQMEDVSLIAGEQETFFYTPHTLDKPLNRDVLNIPSQKYKAVIISRLSAMKNLKDAVRTFQLVVEQIPEAKLEIYGSGKDEKNIKAEIEKCNLQNHVALKGYTHNPSDEFQKAWLTISTSSFEGFGLSNLEALSNGCPVVTYDYDYGVESLVKDHENGFVVERNDIKKLAEKIVLLMKNDKLREQFAIRAFDTAEKYSVQNYIMNWSLALQQMLHIRDERQKLSKVFNSKLPFTLRELQKDCEELVLEIHAPMPFEEHLKLNLVGLDRKYKAQIICETPEKTASAPNIKRFVIDYKSINLEKIRANQTKTLDFYLEISSADRIKIRKRLAVDQAEMASPFSAEEYDIVPYTTVKGNYSWTLNT
ncbi:alpha-glucosyltransferase N-terminal domain-containing protein [Bacillus sp. HSf4]|uniref:alpha-glucosyltransferase N-terminal domain-containing protein n=1 Tax=Bacillus sp. HSf4 TaxID=3035514 RepID=UPI00240A26F9|nr:alpha-glucosyltransferase N-terminal domain-containing protein [Bacillus sp. HSf4]WFA04808.1 alpha-glucosyltransferase N-terminal domain-containing protein [Bacillus sp. HSf4]